MTLNRSYCAAPNTQSFAVSMQAIFFEELVLTLLEETIRTVRIQKLLYQ